MTDALTSLDMSTGFRKVAERAKRQPVSRPRPLQFDSARAIVSGDAIGGIAAIEPALQVRNGSHAHRDPSLGGGAPEVR